MDKQPVKPMTVSTLKKWLDQCPDTDVVVMLSDEEGNGYGYVYSVQPAICAGPDGKEMDATVLTPCAEWTP